MYLLPSRGKVCEQETVGFQNQLFLGGLTFDWLQVNKASK